MKTLCNTLNWGNWHLGFVNLVVWWAERDAKLLNLIFRRQIEVRKCVVYNEDIGRYGAWDADKCTTVMSEQSSTLCECYTTGTFGKN